MDLFRCIRCNHQKLNPEGDALACPACQARYPIERGIPRFVPAENYAGSFGFQWNTHRTTQLDSHTGLPISGDRLFAVTGWPRDLSGQHVLEAGSGAGRFTKVLAATAASLYSFDYSSAVEANYANNGHYRNLTLFQGDIFDIPVAPQRFDKVICLGVLQHTPDPAKAFASLAAQVKPGGQIVIDVYRKGPVTLLHWKYLLRPITRRMDQQRLYRMIDTWVPRLIPITQALRRTFGRHGARLSPIAEYSDLGLPPDTNRRWAILDTFDMYAPAHDHPQSVEGVRRWFEDAGLEQIEVGNGPHGLVGRGRRGV